MRVGWCHVETPVPNSRPRRSRPLELDLRRVGGLAARELRGLRRPRGSAVPGLSVAAAPLHRSSTGNPGAPRAGGRRHAGVERRFVRTRTRGVFVVLQERRSDRPGTGSRHRVDGGLIEGFQGCCTDRDTRAVGARPHLGPCPVETLVRPRPGHPVARIPTAGHTDPQGSGASAPVAARIELPEVLGRGPPCPGHPRKHACGGCPGCHVFRGGRRHDHRCDRCGGRLSPSRSGCARSRSSGPGHRESRVFTGG